MVVCLRNGTRVVVGLLTVFLAVASLSAQTTPSSGPAERSGPSDEATSLPADSLEMEGDAEASETDQEIVQNRRLPVLKGHRFIPTSTVPDPFVTIYLRSNTGFGFLLDARFPVITEADTVGVVEGDIAFALLASNTNRPLLTSWLCGSASGVRYGPARTAGRCSPRG